MWVSNLMSETDKSHNLGCALLELEQDAALYDGRRNILKAQGFDFLDAWYVGNIMDGNKYFSPEVLFVAWN